MKQVRRWFWLLIVTILALPATAQDAYDTAFVLQMTAEGTLQVGQTSLPGPSLFVTYNPASPSSWARTDDFGIMRFAPLNTPEGVYSFSPSFQGFSAPSREENRIFIAEAEWSPNGQQLAFRVASGDPSGSDGVWFWQPAMITSTDPSYHLLRDCPPGCGLANSRDTGEWKSLSLDWAPDNVAILVHMYLPKEERQALGLVFASRDPQSPQADIQPPTYRYEYGSWANDGDRLVVSGFDDEENAVYGFINRDGSNPQLNRATDIGLAYVRNAVHNPVTGQLVMLGSTIGADAPVALYDSSGNALTPQIGSLSPDVVEWSPNHQAVFVRSGSQAFIATLAGELYDITDMIGENQMVTWSATGFPAGTSLMNLPQPQILDQVEATPVQITVSSTDASGETDVDTRTLTAPQTEFSVGQLLQVTADTMTLYREPIAGAEVVAEVEQGEALVLVAGPLTDGVTIWWRIQTLEHIGWSQERLNEQSLFNP